MSEIELKIKSRDLDTLIKIISSINPSAEIDLIRRAYEYAQNSHKDQVRLSGEPFIIHPLEVAIILANLKLDTTTIAAALLHDVVEDTEVSLEILTERFGEEVALLVDGVTKISTLKKKTRYKEEVNSLRKMLLATIKDVRVILIKLADKLHNMRTIMFQPESKQRIIARDVMDIYAPLAGRLGISQMRADLEDLAFHVLHHDEYHEIANKVALRKHEIEDFIEDIRFILYQQLERLNVGAEITGRAKHFYSIYRKMQNQNKPFEEIFDIRAIRIITAEVKDCYGILGIIHTLWSPITSRFKDYVAVPKSNMYQSLHTTVIGPDGLPLEFQIRTWEMHATAEMGIAAHWLYKEGTTSARREHINVSLLTRLRKLDYESQESGSSREFMKELKMDLYEDEIFVFTPKGKIVKLAKGSTPVDFAYAIHTEVGNQCVGARINNQMLPLKTELKSGDIVDIITSKKGHPSEAWLKFVKSSNARYKIRAWQRRETDFDRKEHEAPPKPAEEEKKKPEKTAEVSIPEAELIKIKNIARQKRSSLSIDGTSNVLIKLSQCCQPIPGDDVVGFITRGRGITVHKKNCPSLARLSIERERFINIVWEGSGNTYPVKIAIHGIDRQNLLKDIADEIAACKTNILKFEASIVSKDSAEFKLILEVKSMGHLKEVVTRLKRIKNITNVYKLNEKVLIKQP
ncbi:MAG: bifunctional (p)ppGpp synthetase/guanosine-3',5'-bis(diphosphate) 3'-pyrophosphohydrolase [Spirochaetes bacterium]|nr:MAG: bifunctional (p)ppGpp synthetase/guanosine-3',5'-bis(diphosphate) 3'-pyrophosphohydrolase [Spirochaetota bacterium]